jgi:putative addiction module component (TIGR02574 family)
VRKKDPPENGELTEAQPAELDRRSEELERDRRLGRSLGMPWEEVLRRIRERKWPHRGS